MHLSSTLQLVCWDKKAAWMKRKTRSHFYSLANHRHWIGVDGGRAGGSDCLLRTCHGGQEPTCCPWGWWHLTVPVPGRSGSQWDRQTETIRQNVLEVAPVITTQQCELPRLVHGEQQGCCGGTRARFHTSEGCDGPHCQGICEALTGMGAAFLGIFPSS